MENLLRGQRLSEREIEYKLNRLYELNKKDNESKHEFKKRFFLEGNELDFLLLMYKPICRDCAERNQHLIVEEINFNEPNPDEDIIEPNFRHWSDLICEYCKKKNAYGLVFHVLEMRTYSKF